MSERAPHANRAVLELLDTHLLERGRRSLDTHLLERGRRPLERAAFAFIGNPPI